MCGREGELASREGEQSVMKGGSGGWVGGGEVGLEEEVRLEVEW